MPRAEPSINTGHVVCGPWEQHAKGTTSHVLSCRGALATGEAAGLGSCRVVPWSMLGPRHTARKGSPFHDRGCRNHFSVVQSVKGSTIQRTGVWEAGHLWNLLGGNEGISAVSEDLAQGHLKLMSQSQRGMLWCGSAWLLYVSIKVPCHRLDGSSFSQERMSSQLKRKKMGGEQVLPQQSWNRFLCICLPRGRAWRRGGSLEKSWLCGFSCCPEGQRWP